MYDTMGSMGSILGSIGRIGDGAGLDHGGLAHILTSTARNFLNFSKS